MKSFFRFIKNLLIGIGIIFILFIFLTIFVVSNTDSDTTSDNKDAVVVESDLTFDFISTQTAKNTQLSIYTVSGIDDYSNLNTDEIREINEFVSKRIDKKSEWFFFYRIGFTPSSDIGEMKYTDDVLNFITYENDDLPFYYSMVMELGGNNADYFIQQEWRNPFYEMSSRHKKEYENEKTRFDRKNEIVELYQKCIKEKKPIGKCK